VTPLATLVVSSTLAVAGFALIATGAAQARPSLRRAAAHINRPAESDGAATHIGVAGVGHVVARRLQTTALMPKRVDLRLVGRPAELHATLLLAAVLGGLLGPLLMLTILQTTGAVSIGVVVPIAGSLVGAALAPLAVHADVVERAGDERTDLRFQLSAYLDVVTMLLAGNTGHEGALEQAAQAGDGRLFRELRRRMREVSASGRSLVDALAITGADLGLVELEQVAATATLSAAEGSPVARTLAAKCSTLRATLATEQEAEARLRTSRLTAPIVGMALIFMALVIYPALSFS
jgi:tight adherence protein C